MTFEFSSTKTLEEDVEHFVTLSRKQIAAWVLALVVGTALVSITGAYFGFKASAATVTVSTTPQSTPISAVVPSTDDSAAELVPGTGPHNYPGPTDEFRCKAGFSPVQVPLGKTVEANGAEYRLDDNDPKRESYEDQKSVTVRIKLSAGVSAPTMFVNTGAHKQSPELYPQHMIQIALTPGGTGVYTLKTAAYAKNWENIGIIDYTVCTRLGK